MQRGPGLTAHKQHLALQISLFTELFLEKQAETHSLCVLTCPCMLPAPVAALLNPSYLLVLFQGTKDPLFLTGVTFPSEYPIYEETRIKLTVYDVKDKSHDTVSTWTSFSGNRGWVCQAVGLRTLPAFLNRAVWTVLIFALWLYLAVWCSDSFGLFPAWQLARDKNLLNRPISLS